MTKAIRFRDSLVTIIRGIVDRERPKPRIAEVYSYSRVTGKAEVLLAGETDPGIQAQFSKQLQPTRSRMDDGLGGAQGDIVLIEGTTNNYRITQIINGDAYASGLRTAESRVQGTLNGGGTILWDGINLSWSQDFIGRLGINGMATYGNYVIPMPVLDTAVTIHGVTGFPTELVTASGIGMNPGGLETITDLYWEPTSFADGGAPGVWHLVGIGTLTPIPASWILIASMDLRGAGVISLRLGTGDLIDHWRTPTFSNGWTNYSVIGGQYENAGYRMEPGGRVTFQGLLEGHGTGSLANMLVVPAGYKPKTTHIFLCPGTTKVTAGASGGTTHTHNIQNGPIRVEAQSGGGIAHQDAAGIPTAYLSLSPITYVAAL